MLQIVLDTNVIVAAMRSRNGASAALLAMVDGDQFELNLSVGLALEYEAVLKRPEHASLLASSDADELVAYLCAQAHRHEHYGSHWPIADDIGDEMIVRLAVSSNANYLVTHNVRHFQRLPELGTALVTPGEFLAIIRGPS